MGLACLRRWSCRWEAWARRAGRRRHRADDRPRPLWTCGSRDGGGAGRRRGAVSWVIRPVGLREAAAGARLQHQLPLPADGRPGPNLAGWTMIEVFDTAAARDALARRKLRCPDGGAVLRPWGQVRERTVRELGGGLLTVRPDRARCTGCLVTHVVLDACLLPRRAYSAALVGQALVAAARGRGHRLIAGQLAVPQGTVRGWIRRARASATRLWAVGVQAVVALDPDALPAQIRPDQLAYVLDALGAAAMALGHRFAVPHASPWARVTVLTRGRLLSPSPAD